MTWSIWAHTAALSTKCAFTLCYLAMPGQWLDMKEMQYGNDGSWGRQKKFVDEEIVIKENVKAISL